MAKKPPYEELEQRVGKVERITPTVAIDRQRSRFMLVMAVCFALLLAVPWGEPCFAEEFLSGRTILAKGCDSYVPYSFLNKDGKVDGFDNELFQAVIEAAGLKAKIELELWPIIRKELESDKIDVITGIYYSKERDKLVDFSVPFLIVKYSIFVRKDSKISSVSDLNGKEIIVMQGAIPHDFLEQKGIAGKIVTTKDTLAVLRLLASGRHDCALLVRIQGLYFLKEFNIKNVKTVGEPFEPVKFCFAVREGDSTLLSRLNEGLCVIKDKGKYDEIFNKWFGILEREVVSYRQIPRYAAFILTPILMLLLASLFWARSLKHQVKIKTGELTQELSKRRQAEESVRRSECELRLKNQINNIFLTHPDEKMYEEVLKVILKVMESEYGTFGYFDEDGSFVAPAMSRKIYWEKCNVPEKEIIFQKGTFGGIWGRAIKERKSLMNNDGPFNTPKGHIPVENTMVTPIIFHDKVISAIHIANKPNGYDEENRVVLETIADQIAPVLYARLQRDKQDKERKLAEEKVKEHHKNIELLSNTAMRFVEFPHDKDIYTFIGEQLRELIGKDSYIVINTIDAEKSILTTRAVLGIGKFTDKIAKLLGRHPVGMTFDAKDETLSDLSDGKLHLNKEGLYGILLKTVPKTVCNSIEKLLNIKKIYGIGFTKDNQLFGTIVIFLKEGAGELKNKQIIEALLKQASIAVQKKQAEEALRESEEKFRYLVKNSNDVFVTIDKNGKEIFVSDSVERITGFTPAETMGRSGFEFLHPDDVDHMSETLSKLLETPGGTIRDEYRHRRKGGGWVHLEAIG